MPTMTAPERQTKLASLNRVCAEIERDAELRGEPFTAEEREKWNATMASIRAIESEPSVIPRKTSPDSGAPMGSGNGTPRSLAQQAPNQSRWMDAATGENIRCYGPTERISNGGNELSLGRFVRGMLTNDWRGAHDEKILALAEGGSGGGHFLVPDELSSQWLDKARAESVMTRAGMSTIDMKSETLTIAKVSSDPTFSVVAENTEITGSDVEFAGLMLVSRKIATIITMSRELVQDAANAAAIVEQVLARALAASIDSRCLVGTPGTGSPTGIALTSGVGGTASVGAIAWEDFHTAVVGVRESNYTPNALVAHPTIIGDAQVLTSGDGVNSAKLWLGPPPSMAGVELLPTTAITTAYAIAGEFKHCLLGIRTGASIETTTEGNTAFEKHQLRVKCTQRVAFVVTQPTAFHVLSGITT